MNSPNYGNKYLNENPSNKQGSITEYLEKKDRIKNAMNALKHEVAEELGYNHIKIPYNGDATSREIGMYAGPVGGVVVKDLIAQGEAALLEKYGKK